MTIRPDGHRDCMVREEKNRAACRPPQPRGKSVTASVKKLETTSFKMDLQVSRGCGGHTPGSESFSECRDGALFLVHSFCANKRMNKTIKNI
jgi:hypothetical protein